MIFNNTPPKWEELGVEPSAELQENGFAAGYKPPAAYFNYLFNRYTACIKEIQEITAELKTAAIEMTAEIIALQNTVGDYTGGGTKNILLYETIEDYTDYGAYCEVKNNGCITIDNTTSASVYPKTEKQSLEAGTYTATLICDVVGLTYYFLRGDTVMSQGKTNGGTITYTFEYDRTLTFSVSLVIPTGTTANFYLQLENGDTATGFESHVLSVADVLNSLPTTYVTRAEYEQQMGDINSVLESLIG